MRAPTTPSGVTAGRHTAAYEGDVVVFLIGMRINRLRAVRQWVPVARAMPPMIKELMSDPESGLLGMRTIVGWRELGLVQYWRDRESLEAFAGDRARTHRPAWMAFFRSAFASGSVGIWHETYVVPDGSYESLYANTAPAGLGAIRGLAPIRRQTESFADRLPVAAG